MPERLMWQDVHEFLNHTERELLTEVDRLRPMLHERLPAGGWSAAEVVEHLVRTEILLQVIWRVVPHLRRFPRLRRALDQGNAAFWRMMGLRTIEAPGERLTPRNATLGRFRAPRLLRPGTRQRTYDELLAWRVRVRLRSIELLSALDADVLNTLTWSHPLLGAYTLIEFAQFLGTHELHHLPQIRRQPRRV